jgi:hypothetical protein
MHVTIHESFGQRIAACVRGRLPGEAIISGALAPNEDRSWPRPHHGNPHAASILSRCVTVARQEYLAGRLHEAAFHLGVGAHYALDPMVPYQESSGEHALCEGQFANADRSMKYDANIEVALADGRTADWAVQQLVRAASARPIDLERRLLQAHVCMCQIALAVTEEPEPTVLIKQFSEAFVTLALELEGQLWRYRKAVATAVAAGACGSWDRETGVGTRGALERFSTSAVGAYEVLRSGRQPVAPHIALLYCALLWHFRSRLLAALEQALGKENDTARLRLACRSIAGNYDRIVQLLRSRAGHWDWFSVDWRFWAEKSGLASGWVLGQALEARRRPLAAEEERFRARCAESWGQTWHDSRRCRLVQHLLSAPRGRAAAYAGPVLLLLAVLALLWAGRIISAVAAVLVAAGGAALCLWYVRQALRCWAALCLLARAAAKTDTPGSSPQPP